MPDRVVVFLDYQNVYRRARDAFHHHDEDPYWMGQIHPRRLGDHLSADSPFDRALQQVRVYRGVPSQKRDAKGCAAARRQLSAWEADDRVEVISRTPQYLGDRTVPATQSVREKGIDVSLAIDVVTLAIEKAYDVAIVFSLDTDLHPALEYVARKQRAWGKPRIEVAAWSAADQMNRRLSLKGQNIYCHWVGESAYRRVQDLRDYTTR